MSKKEMFDYLFDRKEKISSIIKEIEFRLDEFSLERKDCLIENVVKLTPYVPNNKSLLSKDSKSLMRDFAIDIIKTYDSSEDILNVLSYIINNCLPQDCDLMAYIIIKLMQEQNIKESCKNTYDSYTKLSKDDFDKISNLYLENIKKLFVNNRFLELKSLSSMNYYWLAKNEEECVGYYNEFLKDDSNKIEFLIREYGESISLGTGDVTYTYNSESYTKIINKNDIYEAIEKVDKSTLVNKYDEEDLIKIACFVLEFQSEDRLSRENAIELIKKWKKQVQFRDLGLFYQKLTKRL